MRTANLLGEAGATLVELMVAVSILAVGILAVALLFPIGAREHVDDRLRTKASFFVQEKLERLREAPWNSTDLSVGSHGPETLGENGNMVRTYLVAAMPPPLENLKKVTMIVTWRDATDTVKAVTYYRR
jgi:Tfp pilus assembly protein PilV